VLILPPGHAQQVQQRYPFRRREKWMIGGVVAVLCAVAVALVISLATADKKSGNGCVSVSLAYSTGGDHVYRCGESARSLCAGVGKVGGITGAPADTVRAQCRKAGLPVS
jgi:hypothetical protein